MDFQVKKSTTASIAKAFVVSAAALLTGCLTMTDLDTGDTYRVGKEVTKTDARGDTSKWYEGEGWKSTAAPEAKIPRLTVWNISKQSSGIKAWRYGFSSDKNYHYIDPAFPILSSTEISDTGWVTYIVASMKEGELIVKRADFRRGGAPEVIGRLSGGPNDWRFVTPAGEAFGATGYELTSKGIFLLRTSSVFTYLPSAQPKAHLLPEGWTFAWYQKGDIEASRLIAIKRPDQQTMVSGNKYLIGFYDIDTGKIVETIKMNLLVRYEADNFQNKFFLYNTTKGPMSIAIEDAHQNVTVRNLRTGEKRIAFHRDAGVSTLQTAQQNTGRVAIKAAVGFKDEAIYDAEDFLYNDRRVPPNLK